MNIRRGSDKSIVSIPEENSHRLDANILSISVQELPAIRVGLKIVVWSVNRKIISIHLRTVNALEKILCANNIFSIYI